MLCGKGPHWPGHIVLKCHVLLRRALRSLEEAWTPGGGSKLLFQCLSAYAYLALKFAIVSGLPVAAHINYFNFVVVQNSASEGSDFCSSALGQLNWEVL